MAARAAIFIDGSNFFKDCEELQIYSYQIEWDHLILDLVGPRSIEYGIYYDCAKRRNEVPKQAKRQQQFFSILRGIPWMRLKFGRLEQRVSKCCGRPHLVEKGVDVQIAADMITGAIDDLYDHAYLMSHDGDFSYIIEAVKKYGKRVLVATPGRSYHLGQAANSFIRLDTLRLNSFLRSHGGP